jgi:hypothetical protein
VRADFHYIEGQYDYEHKLPLCATPSPGDSRRRACEGSGTEKEQGDEVEAEARAGRRREATGQEQDEGCQKEVTH